MEQCKTTFGTKAETLEKLYLDHPELNTPLPYLMSVESWQQDRKQTLAELRTLFPPKTLLAVRSSCRDEDTAQASNAGAFASRLNVPLGNTLAMTEAVDAVIASYDTPHNEHILIQPMVKVVVSGVIMTRALDDGSPYYVLNYDDETRCTDTVTSGKGSTKTVYVYKGVKDSDFDSDRVQRMVRFARTLENIFDDNALDIEFGMDEQNVMHLFQVRPICKNAVWRLSSHSSISNKIVFVEEFVRARLAPRPGLHGSTNILGVMPDWNPAEIIGVTPQPLAASLYREAITRRVWSLAREEMGYRPMPPEELMVLLAGRPYIDVRASFNSFLPDGVNAKTAEKLVEAMLSRLDQHPELHDKIEFEVAFTAMDFDATDRMDKRYPGLLTQDESRGFLAHLTRLTRAAMDLSSSGSLASAEQRIKELATRQAARKKLARAEQTPTSLVSHVRSLLEECCTLGTLPFSILARHGFMAEAILRSAVRRGALTSARLDELKRSIPTISTELSEAFGAVCAGIMAKKDFLDQYGHLRPGTYDILSASYARRKNLFLGRSPHAAKLEEPFAFTASESEAIETLLRESKLDVVDVKGLYEYVHRSIAGREYGKFVFTRNLSEILDTLVMWGEVHDLDAEAVSQLTLPQIMDSLTSPPLSSGDNHFRELGQHNTRICELGRSLKLSYLIRSPRDVYIVPQHRSAPNFITSGKVEAEVSTVDTTSNCDVCITGKIVCIESADPGFDWIFARGIKGLVTKYGGTNSHMAIRCAEYGIPAAIGCGEMLFNRIANSHRSILDPGAHILKPI